jgi:hypothetical protein
MTTIENVENNMRGIVDTAPYLGTFGMRNSVYLTNIWSGVIKALRVRICYYDLEGNFDIGSLSAVVLSPLTVPTRPPLLPCLGESDKILNDHLKQFKVKLKDSGIDVTWREVICILVN